MNRRSLFALAFSAMLVAVAPVWAQGPGGGNGPGGNSGNGPGSNSGDGPPGNAGNSGNNGNGPGSSSAESPQSGSGPANGNPGGGPPPAPPEAGPGSQPAGVTAPPAKGPEQSESDVLAAVEAGRAVPLSSLIPDVRTRTGGEIINAQLVQSGGALLYAVRVLAPDGRVSTQYYDAQSGQYVGR